MSQAHPLQGPPGGRERAFWYTRFLHPFKPLWEETDPEYFKPHMEQNLMLGTLTAHLSEINVFAPPASLLSALLPGK